MKKRILHSLLALCVGWTLTDMVQIAVKYFRSEPPLDQGILSISNGGSGNVLPPPLPSEGGSGTAESFDPSKGSGRLVMSEKLESTPLQWPKTYKAPDGVNTITENEDGTGSMTLAWAPKPKPGELVVRGNDDTYSRISLDDAAKRQQKHVITQAEAEELVKLLSDHAGNLESFLEQLRQERRTDDAAKISADMGIAKAMLAKWRKRVEEARP